jgi:hypothetical protein
MIFEGVEFGTLADERSYVGVDAQRVLLTSIRFRDGHGQVTRLRSDDVALSRAIAYRAHSVSDIVCLPSPLAGLGSSGSFQRVEALIAVKKPRGQTPLRAEGALVRVR